MSSNDRFVAQILETSAGGFAGMSVSLLFERHPGIEDRYQGDGFAGWKAQLQRWLIDLSAAVAASEPRLFQARMRWMRGVFEARGATGEDLIAALEALRDTLEERLPQGSVELPVRAVNDAIEAVAEPAQEGAATVASPDVLAYLERILKGRPREAIDRLLSRVDDGMPVRDAYLRILMPAQGEVGRMWHAGELTVGEEHVISSTTQRLMTLLRERAKPADENGKTVLLACVSGNIHDIGIRAISDFFEMAGWRAINLGPDMPHDEIARSARIFEADVVVLAATLDPHLKEVQRSIERLRGIEDRSVKIIVGGPVFAGVPGLWTRLGADGYAAGVEDVEPLATELVG